MFALWAMMHRYFGVGMPAICNAVRVFSLENLESSLDMLLKSGCFVVVIIVIDALMVR